MTWLNSSSWLYGLKSALLDNRVGFFPLIAGLKLDIFYDKVKLFFLILRLRLEIHDDMFGFLDYKAWFFLFDGEAGLLNN